MRLSVSMLLMLSFFSIMLLTSCSSPREYIESKEYYESGELKKEEIKNPYEYECKEFYKNGKHKKVIYGTEGNLIIREYFPDGRLKRERKASPNKDFENYLKDN